MLAIIDLDPMIFAAGFVVEKKHYIVSMWSLEDEHFGNMVFEGKTALNTWMKENGVREEELEIQVETKLEPFENACQAMDSLLHPILWGDMLNIHHWKMYLSGPNNFRRLMKTDPEYKGHRDPSHRPVYEAKLKDYLIDKYGAEIVPGIEADDACGIEQMRCLREGVESVIISIDKDLNMIPGNHYNYQKKEFYKLSEYEAIRNFYKQMLTGDSADNIKGLTGIGPVKAEKLLQDWENIETWNSDSTLPHELAMQLIYERYCEEFKDDADRMFEQNKKLLWILREESSEAVH